MYQMNKREGGNARLATGGQGLERGETRKKNLHLSIYLTYSTESSIYQ